jgi:effector-binding domain-containing protein
VPIPFGPVLGPSWGEVAGWLASQGVEQAGPVFIRYLTTDMSTNFDLELGIPINKVIPGSGRITTGLLPGGRYVVVNYFGHYDNLVAVTGELIAWAEENNVKWKKTDVGAAEWWTSRYESYPTDPDTEPDVSKWQTDINFLTVE